MGKRYQAVQRCSELLRLSRIPEIDKLMLELKLIQIKKLLLRDHSLKSCGHQQCNEGAFDTLETLIRELTKTELLEPTLDRISQQLEEILEVLWAMDRICVSNSGMNFTNSSFPYR